MKTAVRIVSIVYIPLLALGILGVALAIIFGGMGVQIALQEGSITQQDAQVALLAFYTVMPIVAAFLIASLVLDIIIMKRNERDAVLPMGGNITLAVFAFICGASAAGVLWLIRCIIAEKHQNQPAQE